MAMVRSARLVAIADAEASVRRLLKDSSPPVKRQKLAPGKRRVPAGLAVPSAVLCGLAGGQSQTDVLRLVSPNMAVTLRDVLAGGGKCLICLEECGLDTEMALFTGRAGCCRTTVHSGHCPMTQPGSLCFACAASTIGGGWNSWQEAGGPIGQPKCPCCNVSLCENDVVRVTVLQPGR